MERSTALVIDASVTVKWIVPEQGSSYALKIRNAHVLQEISLFAPDLLTYEVANALRFKLDLREGDMKRAIESIFEVDLSLMGPTSQFISRAASLARAFDITIYAQLTLR